MATNFHTTILSEGQSIMNISLFNGENYAYWKKRMKLFSQENDYEVWRTIVNGPLKLIKEENEWDTNDIAMIQLNAQAMHTFFCELGENA